jgi:CheY-like chemotaxis protein
MHRVLMINDEHDLLEVCQLILESVGHRVMTIAHAKKEPLLEAIRGFGPDVVLLDLVMPAASGEEVARWLHAEPRMRHVPILVMSALSDGPSIARHLGASGFLRKPFTDDALVGAVRRLLKATATIVPSAQRV